MSSHHQSNIYRQSHNELHSVHLRLLTTTAAHYNAMQHVCSKYLLKHSLSVCTASLYMDLSSANRLLPLKWQSVVTASDFFVTFRLPYFSLWCLHGADKAAQNLPLAKQNRFTPSKLCELNAAMHWCTVVEWQHKTTQPSIIAEHTPPSLQVLFASMEELTAVEQLYTLCR